MKIFYSENHRLRDAKTELYGGQLVPAFEGPFRADYILEGLKAAQLDDITEPDIFNLDIAKQVHNPDYLAFLETAWQRWLADGYKGEAIPTCFPTRRLQQRIPQDIDGALGYYCFASETSINAGTYEGALSAMNCALSAAQWLGAGHKSAFAFARPPGHHAAHDYYGGYCFINNAAVAAQALLNQGFGKVAVLDVDFHHGNGTQDIFYERDDVFFASIHGDPSHAFPHFLGFADETGQGKGMGANLNIPLPPKTGFDIWQQALDKALHAIRHFKAEAIIVSLGVDTYKHDPISFFTLDSEDFTTMGAAIAAQGLPTIFVLEGGYGVKEIGKNVANTLIGFSKST